MKNAYEEAGVNIAAGEAVVDALQKRFMKLIRTFLGALADLPAVTNSVRTNWMLQC
jgi:hypothetical protein